MDWEVEKKHSDEAYMSVAYIMICVYKEMEHMFQGSTWENGQMLYHNSLSLMTVQDM